MVGLTKKIEHSIFLIAEKSEDQDFSHYFLESNPSTNYKKSFKSFKNIIKIDRYQKK
jgi:hypothetical protein